MHTENKAYKANGLPKKAKRSSNQENKMENPSPISDGGLNLKATELRLGLPGVDDDFHEPSSRFKKRASSEMDHSDQESIAPLPKARAVGWPPVRSYRKNALQAKTAEPGSGMLVKVSMDGAPYLRKVDLKFYDNYLDLLKALEKLFMCTIEREGYNGSEFVPTYEDKDGDLMLVGDVTWDMFINSCKRLRIIKGYDRTNVFHS